MGDLFNLSIVLFMLIKVLKVKILPYSLWCESSLKGGDGRDGVAMSTLWISGLLLFSEADHLLVRVDEVAWGNSSLLPVLNTSLSIWEFIFTFLCRMYGNPIWIGTENIADARGVEPSPLHHFPTEPLPSLPLMSYSQPAWFAWQVWHFCSFTSPKENIFGSLRDKCTWWCMKTLIIAVTIHCDSALPLTTNSRS